MLYFWIGGVTMKYMRKFWRDEHGQDLAEYVLMTGFVAVAAGAIMPTVAASIRNIFESVKQMTLASAHTDTLVVMCRRS